MLLNEERVTTRMRYTNHLESLVKFLNIRSASSFQTLVLRLVPSAWVRSSQVTHCSQSKKRTVNTTSQKRSHKTGLSGTRFQHGNEPAAKLRPRFVGDERLL